MTEHLSAEALRRSVPSAVALHAADEVRLVRAEDKRKELDAAKTRGGRGHGRG
jgi:hypothetical protein